MSLPSHRKFSIDVQMANKRSEKLLTLLNYHGKANDT